MAKKATATVRTTKKPVKASVKDLKPKATEAVKGGATARFDPYKNFKF